MQLVVTCTALASLIAVAVGFRAVAGVEVSPEGVVDGDAMPLHRLDGVDGGTPRRVVDAGHVGGIVVDEVAHEVPTESRIGLGVEDERVPPDVDERGRTVVTVRLELDE